MSKLYNWLKLNWLAVACITATFFLLLSLCFRLDPDLGWHLQVGKDLAVNHIFPRTDFYTFAFQGYGWRDHEWLAEAPLYYLWQVGGYSLLVGIFAFLWFFPFWFNTQKVDLKKKSLIAFLGVFLSSSFVGVRLQALTLIGLAILIRLFDNYLKGDKKLLYYYPLIILLWANLHGSFVYGLLAGLIFLLFNLRSKRSIWLRFLPSFLLAIALTFLNPYGAGLWQEIWIALQPGYKPLISEWQTLFAAPANYPLLVYCAVFILFLITNFRRKLSLPNYYLALVAIFFVLAAMSRRNASIFVLLSLPVLVEWLAVDDVMVKLNSFFRKLLKPALITISLVTIANYLAMPYWLVKNPNPFSSPGNYPSKEVVALLKRLPENTRVFASYDYGGFLIHEVPNVKIFIDGRGSYWRLGDKLAVQTYLDSLQDFSLFQDLQRQYGFEVIVTGAFSEGKKTDPLTGEDLSNYRWQELTNKLIHSGEWKLVTKNTNQSVLVLKSSPLRAELGR